MENERLRCTPPLIRSHPWPHGFRTWFWDFVFRPLFHRAHVEHEFRKLRSANSVSVQLRSTGDWSAPPHSQGVSLGALVT